MSEKNCSQKTWADYLMEQLDKYEDLEPRTTPVFTTYRSFVALSHLLRLWSSYALPQWRRELYLTNVMRESLNSLLPSAIQLLSVVAGDSGLCVRLIYAEQSHVLLFPRRRGFFLTMLLLARSPTTLLRILRQVRQLKSSVVTIPTTWHPSSGSGVRWEYSVLTGTAGTLYPRTFSSTLPTLEWY